MVRLWHIIFLTCLYLSSLLCSNCLTLLGEAKILLEMTRLALRWDVLVCLNR